MSIVDNRVVKMTFDNSNFEKNLKTTMDSLSKFEKSLKLDGATAGFDALKQATDKLNMSAIGDKADKEAKRIDQMSTDARKSIDGIDDAAANADFSALSNAAGDAVNDINAAAEKTDFSPTSNAAIDAAMDINTAAASVDLSNISDSANDAAESFKALEIVAAGVLLGIGEKITNLATGGLSSIGNKIKEYTITPIVDGFKEYETQMGSIQTIMANTGMDFSSDADIQVVNDALDELNTYADKTIYNFTEMTRNIGTFTAAGIELEPATKAIQGIANLAALSGSNSQQASTAMYQLSQALSSGTLKLQDWNSVVNAGMGGEVFQEALKRTARAHGIAVDEMIEANGSFRESLQEGWISADILTETLNQMSISYDKASMSDERYKAAFEDLISKGYEEQEATEILRLAKVAEQSATKVRTWSQLWDTVKEAIGSQWSSVWRNFIGDFKQATDTFTFLSNTISKGVDSMLGGIVKTFQIFNSFEDTEGFLGEKGAIYRISETFWGGFERDEDGNEIVDEITGEFVRIKGAFDYLVEAVTKPLGAIKAAFDKVFGMDDYTIFQNLSALVLAFTDFAKSLVISDNAADGLRRIFEALFSIIDIGIHVIMDLGAAFFGVIGILRMFIDPLVDLVLIIGGQLGLAVLWVRNKILELREAFVYMISPIGEIISVIKELISRAFGFSTVKNKIEGVRYTILNVLEFFWKLLDIPGKLMAIGDFLRDLFGWDDAVYASNMALEKEGKTISALDIWVKRLLDNPVIAFFASIGSAIGKVLGVIGSLIDSFISIGDAFSKPKKDANELSSSIGGVQDALGSTISILGTVGSVINTIVGTLASIIVPVLSTIFNVLRSIISALGRGFLTILGGIATVLVAVGSAIMTVANAIANIVSSGLPIFIDLSFKLAKSIGDLVVRLWNFFLAWEPIKGIIKIVQDFKTKVVDFFISIPSKIFGAGNSIAGSLSDTQGIIKNIVTLVESWISSINKLTPEEIMNNIENGFSGAVSRIQGIIDTIKNINFEDVAGNMMNGLQNLKISVIKTLSGVARYIINAFPSSAGVIRKFFGNVMSISSSAISKLQQIIKDAKENSENMPEFIGNLIGNISSMIIKGAGTILKSLGIAIATIGISIGIFMKGFSSLIYESIKAIVSGEGLSKVAELWKSFGQELNNIVKNSLQKINPSFAELYEKIVGFFSSITGESSGWRVALSTALDILKEEFKDLPNKAREAFDNFKKIVVDAVDSIAVKFSTVSGPIGGVFTFIHNKITDLRKGVGKESSKISGDVGTATETIWQKVSNMWKSIQAFFIGTEDSKDGGFIGRIVEFFSGKASSIIESVKKIPTNFGDFLDNVINAFTPERIEKIKNIIMLVGKIKLLKSLRELMSGLGKLSSAFARRMKGEDTQTINEKLRDWAITFAILGATLWVISTIKDPWKGVAVIAACGGLLLALNFLSSLIKNKFEASGSKDLVEAAASLLILAIGIRMMLKTVEALNTFDYAANWKGLVALGVFMVAFAGWTHILGNGGKNAIKAAAGLLIMSFALRLMLDPIKEISNFANTLSNEQMIKAAEGLAAVALFMVALGGAMRLAGPSALGSGVAFILMAASVDIIVDAINKIAKLAHLDMPAILVAMGGVALIIGEFAAIAKFVPAKDLILAGVSMLIFSGSISIIVDAVRKLAILGMINIRALIDSIGGIAILIGEFSAIAQLSSPKKLLSAGVSLIMFAGAITIISSALSKLAGLDTNKLKVAAVSIGAIIGIFALLVGVLSMPALSAGATTILPLLSLAFISLGVACALIGIGLEHAVNGIIQLALASPILEYFATTIANNVGTFLLAAVGIGALGAAFAIFGPTAVIAGAGIWLLANGIRDFLILMIQLPILLPLAADAFGKVFDMIIKSAGGFVPKLAEWWNSSAWPWLQEKLAQAKAFFFTTVLPMLQTFIFQTIPTKLGEFIGWLRSWWGEHAPQILQRFVEFKDGLMKKLKEILPVVRDWILDTVIPKAKERVGEIVSNAKDYFGTKLKEFIDGIPGMAQAALDNISENIKTLGENIAIGIANGIAAGAHWVWEQIQALAGGVPETAEEELDEHSPSRVMRDRVGRYIPEGMAVGIRDFSGAVVKATKDMANETTDTLNSELSRAKYTIPSPSLSPVMNMDDTIADISSYNNMLRNTMLNGNVRLNNGFTGEMSLSAELASKLDADMSKSDSLASAVHDIQSTLYSNLSTTEDLYGRTNTILSTLSGDASSIRAALSNGMNLYMDKSTLVGAIAPEMDDILGRRAILAGRGVY